MSLILRCVIVSVMAYLMGSVSVGILLSKAAGGPDLHTVGSGSTGATNVQRAMGWKYGLMTLFGDGLKGILACWIGSLIVPEPLVIPLGAVLAGLFVTIGHNWPLFFRFQGGKGVATSAGIMLYCFPVPALICIALTIALIAAIRYVSVGSMFMVTSYALIVTFFYSQGNPWLIVWVWALALMCIIRHHANIKRLIHHQENRLGKKAK